MRNHSRTPYILAAALSALSLLFLAEPCAQLALAADGAAPKLIAVTDAGPVYLQALDAPGNPYAGQYSELDAWVYDHTALLSEAEVQAQYGAGPEARALAQTRPADWRLQMSYADEQGYLLPIALQQRRRQELLEWKTPAERINFRPNPESMLKLFDGLHKVYAVGSLPAELQEFEGRQWSQLNPADYPPIPAWLGENPPLETVFVPNGEILCVGPLGLRYTEDADDRLNFERNRGLLTYRYDLEGRLLGSYDLDPRRGGEWMLIYWPQMDSVLNSYSGNNLSRHVGEGTFAVVKEDLAAMLPGSPTPTQPDREILACFDYDGTIIDPNQPLMRRYKRCGNAITGESLKQVYEAQLASGATSADTQSPFAGTEQGPIIADPTPRPRPLIAGDRFSGRARSLEEVTVTDGSSRRWVVVQPLNDPANPWRGSYGPWDAWLLAQHNARNPRLDAAFEKQRRDQSDLRARLAAEKREPSAEEQRILNNFGMAVDSSDPWQYVELRVDADGFVVPFAHSSVDDLLDVAERDQREAWSVVQDQQNKFVLNCGGEMPADLQAQLYEAQGSLLAAKGLGWPRIPAWLIEQPAERAAFAPSGDVITYGPLGSYNPDRTLDYNADRRLGSFDGQYHRYAPDGSHINALPAGAAPPCALYNLALLQHFPDLEARGMLWSSDAGITVVADKQSREVVEAYDWDGSPLAVDQPLHGYPLALRWWEYNELLRLFEAQGPD